MSRIVLVSDTPNADLEVYRTQLPDADVHTFEVGDERALLEAPESDALVVDGSTPVTPAVLDAHPDLEVVARAGTGVDNVDVSAADERGVPVTNVPGYATDEVATHAVSLLLAARRYLVGHDRAVRDGEWNAAANAPAPRLVDSTLGLVSFGDIARRFVELVDGFEFDVVVYDPYVDEETVEEYDARLVDFGTLLESADAVSIHAPLTAETEGMFDAEAFATLPDHAVVVNVGRGGVVDEGALAEALEAGEVAAAGLDVFAAEPPTESPLPGRDDVICTPHSAWYSEESRRELNETVAENIAAAFDGETPPDAIDPDAEWDG